MGKRKYSKIERIENQNSRNITYLKRVKGIIKKAIELSQLCDQDIFMFVVDKQKKRCVHFASDPELDLMSVFNSCYDRDFMSN